MDLNHLIDEISEELKKIPKITLPRARNTKKTALRILVDKLYGEVILISERISCSLTKRRNLQEIINAAQSESRPIPVSAKEYFSLSKIISLDIKILYSWAYNISESFKNSGLGLDMRELNRICIIRHKFITHFSDKDIFRRRNIADIGSIMFGPNVEDVKILFTPIFQRRSHFQGIKQVEKALHDDIPEIGSFTNHHDKVSCLYKYMSRLSDKTKRELAENFLSKVGVQSESPAVILETLYKVLIQYRKKAKLH